MKRWRAYEKEIGREIDWKRTKEWKKKRVERILAGREMRGKNKKKKDTWGGNNKRNRLKKEEGIKEEKVERWN